MDAGVSAVAASAIVGVSAVVCTAIASRALKAYVGERRFDSPAESLTEDQIQAMLGVQQETLEPAQPQRSMSEMRRIYETGEADEQYSPGIVI